MSGCIELMMSETIEELRNQLFKWNEAFESKVLKVILGKTKVMISDGITKDGMSTSNVHPCGVCSLRVNTSSFLCSQCGKWIHSRCAGVKMESPKFSRNFTCTFSHSSSFTITPTLPTPYPFPNHHSLYLLPLIPSIILTCHLHLNSCKHTY